VLNEHLQQLIGVCFDGLTNLDKFHHVDPPFAAFVFGDKRLRPTKAFGELVLCQPPWWLMSAVEVTAEEARTLADFRK
jgi:hypothetical protein